ncbi:hypothetical protein HY620_01115, partial [Candidatus Uhrbacteria bacterium]|nr:hypothetical protein [Candidatus Uhrbacteria bacterium]
MSDEIKISPPRVEQQPGAPETTSIEKKGEQSAERARIAVEQAKEAARHSPALKPRVQTKPAPPVQPKSELRLDIEDILEEDLQDIYFQMTPKQRLQFKTEGEKTAGAIEQLFKKAQVKIVEIISYIKHWLLLIPGVSKFFMEQEAKIKADKIYDLHTKEDI